MEGVNQNKLLKYAKNEKQRQDAKEQSIENVLNIIGFSDLPSLIKVLNAPILGFKQASEHKFKLNSL